MEIKSAEDIELLDQRIKSELGIDVSKYRNDKVAENFVKLLVFPEYVITWVIGPLLISLLVYILGFFIIDLVHIQYVLYALLGLILFLITGLLGGLLLLTGKMNKDIRGIVDYSLDIMKSSVLDTNLVNKQVSKENRKDVLSMLFKGIIHIVTIPMLTTVISEKIPFVGGVINWIVKKVLSLIASKAKFDEGNIGKGEINHDTSGTSMQVYSNSISSVSKGLGNVTKFTFGIVRFPLKISFWLTLIILVIFLYLIN